MFVKRWLAASLMTAFCGCSRAPASRAVPVADSVTNETRCTPAAWDGNLHRTADLVLDPELRARVDALTKEKVVTLTFLSLLVVRRSRSYEVASAVFERATRCDLRALTRHENVVVRGYVAQEIIDSHPGDVDSLAPLLDDDSHLQSWHERPRNDSIACFVAEALEIGAKKNPHALALYLDAAQDPKIDPVIRGDFLERLAIAHHPEARGLALAMLTEPNATLRESGLRSLEDVGTAEDVGVIVPFTGTKFGPTDPDTRVAAITALGAISARASVDALKDLLGDADGEVRLAAARAYARQPGSDPDVVLHLLGDGGLDASAQKGLAERGDDFALAQLEPIWMNDPKAKDDLLFDLQRADKSAHVPVLRRLLDAKSIEVRRSAIYFLGEAHDLQSAPRIRSFFGSPDQDTRMSAAEASAAMGDRGAIPGLMQMVAHEDSYSAGEGALEALVALHAREAIPVIEARQARHQVLDFLSFEPALRALRAGTDWPGKGEK